MCRVITGDSIQKFRLQVIKNALKLESIGMKGKVNAANIARDILSKAGIKPKRNKRDLLIQFSDYIK